MEKISFFKIFILILLYTYNPLNVKAQAPLVIDIEAGMNRPGSLMLSEMVDDIEYIPLETNSDNLIGYIDNLKFIDELFFIENQTPSSLFVFDLNGNFIRKIGTRGRGPNQYNFIIDYTFFKPKQQVSLLTGDPYKILNYKLNGVYLNQIKYSMSDLYSTIECIFDNKYLVTRTNAFGNTPFTYNIYSDDNKLKKNAIVPVQFEYPGSVFGMGKSFCFYEFIGNYYVKANVLNDTLYRISSSLEFIPQYYFELGKYKQTLEFRHNFMKYLKKKAVRFIVLNYIYETSNTLIYSYMFEMKIHYGYYDKTIKKCFNLNSEGIPNDFDGGIDFFPKYQINNKCVSYVNALELIEYVASDAFKNSTPKYPEKKKALEELANSLDINDNPVIMLVKLKE